MAEHEVTPEQLAEQIRRLNVSDLLLSTCSTLAQLGYAKLDRDALELEQAQVAIEALRALGPVLERAAGDELGRDFRQVVANLQLAYAEAAARAGDAEPADAEEPEQAP